MTEGRGRRRLQDGAAGGFGDGGAVEFAPPIGFEPIGQQEQPSDADQQPQEAEATNVTEQLNATEQPAIVRPPTVYEPPSYEPQQPQKPPRRTLELTLILSLTSTPLPRQITAELLSSELKGSKAEFLELLAEPSSSSSSSTPGYFASATDMPTVLAVDEVTDPPTSRPTSSPTLTATLPEEDDSIDGTLLAVVLVVMLWVGSTVYGVRHVFRARRLRRLARIRQFVTGATTSGYMGTRIYDEEAKDLNGGGGYEEEDEEEDSFDEDGGAGKNLRSSGLLGKKSRRDLKVKERKKSSRKKNTSTTRKSNGHGHRSSRPSSNGTGARDRNDSQENFDDMSSMVDSYSSRESSDEYFSEGEEVEEFSEDDEGDDLI